MTRLDELNIYSQVADWMRHGYKLHKTAVVDAMQAEIDFLRAQLAEKNTVIEGLREAIAPFAKIPTHGTFGGPLVGVRALYEDGSHNKNTPDWSVLGHEPVLKARAALNAAPNTDGAQ